MATETATGGTSHFVAGDQLWCDRPLCPPSITNVAHWVTTPPATRLSGDFQLSCCLLEPKVTVNGSLHCWFMN